MCPYDADGFSSYFKCNGAIEVHVAEDGTEFFEIPDDFKWVTTEDGDDVCCPDCGSEDLYYYNGEYICVDCETTFTEQELVDGHGNIIHG